ncbi:hypothetical protein [Citrobacter sedlakii]|uniref:hypothetical protein n=1 Tax=Citrobacter sedlakii TaxID=67826 RepID=UPI001BA9E84F|nr:hypothetical protein [Citrobacter sedlakii]EKJ8218458.1 hypothetical protein [Citrobacter sedlakii]QUC31305.1 hypothetical protein JY391_06095 [Citrobacter sedlakii]
MAYGLQIFRNDGSLWISPDVTPLNFMGKVRFSNGVVNTGIPSNKSLMFFVRHDGPHGAGIFIPSNSGGSWIITVTYANYSGDIYLFSNHVKSQHGWGVAVYNSAQEMVWNTDMRPLQVFRLNNPQGINQNAAFTVAAGRPVAVNPGICSTWIAPIDPAAGIFLTGAMAAGAYGDTVYGTRINGRQQGGGVPAWRYKDKFICIDTSLYP